LVTITAPRPADTMHTDQLFIEKFQQNNHNEFSIKLQIWLCLLFTKNSEKLDAYNSGTKQQN